MGAQYEECVLNDVREVAGLAVGFLEIKYTNHPCMNSM